MTTRFDEQLVENIRVATQVARCVVVVGERQHDRLLLVGSDDLPRLLNLERVCHESIPARATWNYEPVKAEVSLVISNAGDTMDTTLPTKTGERKSISLEKVLELFSKIERNEVTDRFALVIDAGFLLEDSSVPRDDDFRLTRILDRYSRVMARHQTVILRAPRPTVLPGALLSAPQVRTVYIPVASRDVRYAYARKRGTDVADRVGMPIDTLAASVSDATDDWTLDQVDALIDTVDQQKVCEPQDIEELARAVQIGTTNSPWAGRRIRTAVATARETLEQRVIGQPAAIEAVDAGLRKATIGLSTAHQSRGSQAPRAVFFFAGPTGTGKTELAKAISELTLGHEKVLRIDCAELREEHAVSRLIGAPPGYVGYQQGGELTDGIRAKPDSVVLLDEIEKAHPRFLDTMLSVLDDGRLTSGQGETSYFGQAILIFTSNLGMYEEIGSGIGRPKRRARFDYDTPFETIEAKVREAVRDEFVSTLGRPELLGRLGGADSIIVFDYLRAIDKVTAKFVANIAAQCRRQHDIELEVDDTILEAVVVATQSRPGALELGGRGIRPELDRILTGPLADFLFTHPDLKGRVRASHAAGQTHFTS